MRWGSLSMLAELSQLDQLKRLPWRCQVFSSRTRSVNRNGQTAPGPFQTMSATTGGNLGLSITHQSSGPPEGLSPSALQPLAPPPPPHPGRHSPGPDPELLTTLPTIALNTLRKQLGGGVGGDSCPQPKDALPFFDLFPTQKP